VTITIVGDFADPLSFLASQRVEQISSLGLHEVHGDSRRGRGLSRRAVFRSRVPWRRMCRSQRHPAPNGCSLSPQRESNAPEVDQFVAGNELRFTSCGDYQFDEFVDGIRHHVLLARARAS